MSARRTLEDIKRRVSQAVSDEDMREFFPDLIHRECVQQTIIDLQRTFVRLANAYNRRHEDCPIPRPPYRPPSFKRFLNALVDEIEKNQR